MSGTLGSEIIDLAFVTIQDYKLDKLFRASKPDWEKVVMGYLRRAIPLFNNCKQPLDFNLITGEFTSSLNIYEMDILASWFAYIWLEKVVNDLSQLSGTMTPNDFRRHSEANNLKEKSEYKDRMREIASQKMTDYALIGMDWQNWGNTNV